jgi:hypothetical protein
MGSEGYPRGPVFIADERCRLGCIEMKKKLLEQNNIALEIARLEIH